MRIDAWLRKTIGKFLTVHTPLTLAGSFNAVLLFCEIFFIYIVTTLFEVVGCMSGAYGQLTLVANPQIECFSSAWWAHLFPTTLVAGIIYLVCLPAVLLYGIRKIHKTEPTMNDEHFLAWSRFSSVVFKFKRSFRWWMFIIMGRKLVISVVIASFPTAPLVQAMGSLMVLFVGIVVQLLYSPYRLRQHNQVDWFLASMHLLLLLCGVLFYIDRFATRGVWEIVVVISLTLIIISCLFMARIMLLELRRLATDKPVNSESSTKDLFARRHIAYTPSMAPLLESLQVSRAAFMRYLSICSDSDLVQLTSVADAVALSLSQTKRMPTSTGLIALASKYASHDEVSSMDSPFYASMMDESSDDDDISDQANTFPNGGVYQLQFSQSFPDTTHLPTVHDDETVDQIPLADAHNHKST
ncbi:uncharacterized protein AMSG_11655 [Thecamonas trahens ATCC 50062]|uniref:TRP C-terminal domain-containing protein n=1 Tax=Thecamonas trahens ATCC 50062 TaxID=461836 RepID=A0A0L0DT88_THETB|nr:hypothetical protein AMSG_11655 [Thecamonas trahens ATCC 50062]KNC54653.1 hypothetical protein AMSG_11655 [Thecamonas trahens ATCC 50062]|eukprot:XP_013761765.1 hypothetical protein AMSG_11655 [Thecamonas trahens ATCC 50062]